MSTVSRADLYLLLQDTPASLQAELADLFGFGVQPRPTHTFSFSASEINGAATSDPEETVHIKQAEWSPVFWMVDSYQARVPQPQKKFIPSSRTNERADQPTSQALFSLAKQQLLWDQCLTEQHQSKKPDIPLAVKLLAQVKPLTTLPKLTRETQNQETVLFLDRSDTLTPLWEDQFELAESLQKNVGREQCQVLLMHHGILGVIRKWQDIKDENWSFDQLPSAARLVFMTDLGEYSQLRNEQRAWAHRLKQLKRLGHSISVLSPTPQQTENSVIQSFCLDNKASQFPKLQQAIAGCLQAKLPRIRQIRQQVTNGSLADELTLWNHPDRMKTTGLNWRLSPEYIDFWAQIALLSPSEKQQLNRLQASWRASLHKETEGLEQLIEEIIDPDNQADASVLDEVLDRYINNPKKNNNAYQWLMAQLPLLKIAASHTAGIPKWHKLNQQFQSVLAQHPLTLTDELQPETVRTFYITQKGADLLCTTHAGRALLSSNNAIFNISTTKCLKIGETLRGKTVYLRTRQADIQLKTLTQPDWANRIWQEAQGIFASHSDNAVFHLQPASADNPKAQWVCQHNPWTWASETGIDEKGLWATLQVKQASYRLRWINLGQFMMGSPEGEADRSDDETPHLVTLTQGYWLGETSCTQAFWLAVMEDNPSKFKTDLQWPVEQISWDDCQRFLSRLSALFPDFMAQLPTEAQWEYASRAGTKTAYWWGEQMDKHYANYNSKQTDNEMKYPANGFGLRSMSGNVWEWCSDRFGEYSAKEVTGPTGASFGQSRVLRGGSWDSSGRGLRAASRSASGPDDRGHDYGFRLAGGLDPQARKQEKTANRGPWNGQAGGSIEQE